MNNIKLIKIAFLLVIFCNVAVDISHKIILQNIAFKIFDGSEQVVLISIINAMILMPFLLFFSVAGFISDKYDKKDVLIYGALSSFCLSVLMVIAYALSSFYFAMFTLFLLAVQSTIYSPAKFGIIINLYKKENLAKGNSVVQAVSMISILLTMGLFSFFFESIYSTNSYELITSKDQLLNKFLPLTFYICLIALVELLVSFLILKKIQTDFEIDENYIFKTNDFLKGKLLRKNLKRVNVNKIIFLSVIGLSVFWGISQGMLAVFPAYAKEYLNITNVFVINAILASSGIGIGLGSYTYSKLSKNYIETGTIPIAALFIALMIFISVNVESVYAIIGSFLAFGFFGGLFVVPLNSLIQFNSRIDKLGTVLAGNNWYQSLFMFKILCLTTIVSLYDLDTLSTIYLLFVLTILGAVYTVIRLPQSLIYFFVKFVVGMKYKLEVIGLKNIPSTKGVLLLGNHVSWLDWAVIQMSMPRDVKYVMDKNIYSKWYLKWFLRFFHVIPICPNSSKDTIKKVAQSLDEGNVVVLFPEGSITRNGHLGEFKKGFELILKKTSKDIPVVAFYIRGLWESMFSRANKKFIQSYRTNSVSISFSKPIKKENANAQYIKKQVMDLAVDSWSRYIDTLETIPNEIFNRLKEVKGKLIVADSTGMKLSGYKFLTISILFKNLLKPIIKEQNVGLLIPSTAAGAFTNTSVLMLGKTAVNLNYTSDISSIKHSIQSAQIKSIITSKKFISKLESRGIYLKEILQSVNVIYLEDLKQNIKKSQGLLTLLSVKFLPTFFLKFLHVKSVDIKSNALIMFSSGSEGKPKGIKLSHINILGNTKQIASVLNVNENDAIVGSLPLFHAFGACVTTFLPLIEGIKMVAHADPTDGLEIAKLVKKHNATIMCGTSTFFRLYVSNKKIHPLMFDSLRLVVAGAEKLSSKVREDFKNRFGKEILEGYGTTETSPVVSCNLPDILTPEFEIQKGNKNGSVGMPLPGTSIKIVNPKNFEELMSNEEGMVLIGGVQVMKGYLKDDVKTSLVVKEINNKLWYITGDKGKLDSDGFLTIVDRYSRFAKLGGEMISLGSIEEKISQVVSSEETEYVAVSTPHEKKGEKITLLISNISNDDLIQLKSNILKEFDNKLMIPSEYKIVDKIPKLGSGKNDYSKAKEMAIM